MSLISKFGEVEFSHWCFHILPKVMSERGLRQFSSPFHLGISLYSWDNLPDLCVCVCGAPIRVQVHMHVFKRTCRSQGQPQTVFLRNHALGF